MVAIDDSAIWVTAPHDGSLLRVDPASHEVLELDGFVQPANVAVGEGAVWVLSGTWNDQSFGDGSLRRLDPATNQIVATIELDEKFSSAGGLAVGEGSVWARTSFTMLAKIDPASNTVVERFKNEKGNGDVKVGFGSVWLSDFAFNMVWRLPA
jgi:streptogramin lyase